MPEITIAYIGMVVAALVIGLILGWIIRGERTKGEKVAINSGWQEQIEAQRLESSRLQEQNKSLMEQNSQFQASNKDAKMRASELSDALKEAFARRDELQRQIKDIRGNLEVAVTQREQLQADMRDRSSSDASMSDALKKKDEKIFRLSRELDNWHQRLPPLLERYRVRNQQAEQLETDLAAARVRVAALESMVGSEQTRVEPVDPDALTDGLDASNDPLEATLGTGLPVGDGKSETAFSDPSDAADSGDLRSASAEVSNIDPLPVGNGSLRDNLQAIKGVGPAIEKTLNEMGIFRFSQIADMSEYDINRIANRLKGFSTRIHREDWIGQARDLLTQTDH